MESVAPSLPDPTLMQKVVLLTFAETQKVGAYYQVPFETRRDTFTSTDLMVDIQLYKQYCKCKARSPAPREPGFEQSTSQFHMQVAKFSMPFCSLEEDGWCWSFLLLVD
ncbi:hypothetical protein Ancab_033741 [Ancistrocladus abbreviatus]